MNISQLDPLERLVVFSTISFLISLFTTILLVPLVNKLGIKYNILDKPNKRKTHKKSIVRLGGIAMIFGLMAGLFFTLFLIKDYLEIDTKLIKTIVLGSIMYFGIGICDDIKQLKPIIKLILQIIISTLIYTLIIKIDAINITTITNEIQIIRIPKMLSLIISVIFISGITNGINWLDGIDGLASGISIIIGVGLYIILISQNQIELALLLTSLIGTTIGFIRYNFYPARILMGDSGSYLLGSSLGIIGLIALSRDFPINEVTEGITISSINSLDIRILAILFIVPIFDMLFTITSRLFSGRSPFYPDRRHIHLKLIDSGHPQRYTVIFLYSIAILAASYSLVLCNVKGKVIYMCLSTIISTLLLIYCVNFKKHIDKKYLRVKNQIMN